MLKYNQLPFPFQKHVIDEISKVSARNLYQHKPDYFYMKYEIEKIIIANKPIINEYNISDLDEGFRIDFVIRAGDFSLNISKDVID